VLVIYAKHCQVTYLVLLATTVSPQSPNVSNPPQLTSPVPFASENIATRVLGIYFYTLTVGIIILAFNVKRIQEGV